MGEYKEKSEKDLTSGAKDKPDQKKVPILFDKEIRDVANKYVFDHTEYWFAMSVDSTKEIFVRDFLTNRKHYKRGIPVKEFESKTFLSAIQDEKRKPETLVQAFVASQYEFRQYSDRKVYREKMLIPGVVFVRLRNCERTEKIFDQKTISSFVKYFFFDKITHRPEPIPEVQMNTLISFVENNIEMVDIEKSQESEPSPDEIKDKAGSSVRIVKGPCAGLQGVLKAVRTRTMPAKDYSGNTIQDTNGNPVMEKKIELDLELNSCFSRRFLILLSEVEFLD